MLATMKSTRLILIGATLFLIGSGTRAQLSVAVLPSKIATQKAIIPLEMKNSFAEEIQSARAVLFLLDPDGNMISQATRWVIGGTKNTPGLMAGETKVFYFVITAQKPHTTNMSARIQFNRLILKGGRLADLTTELTVKYKH